MNKPLCEYSITELAEENARMNRELLALDRRIGVLNRELTLRTITH